ncbi:MAG: cobalamin-dependent protein [Pseudomonadota bacterium]
MLVTKIGLDGHDLGAKWVAKVLSNAGMEVVYLGKFQTPERVVEAAIAEDVDIIGISVLSPNHSLLIPKVIGLLKGKNIDNIHIIVGGIVPEPDTQKLMRSGVGRIFGHHSTSEEIIGYIKEWMGNRAGHLIR